MKNKKNSSSAIMSLIFGLFFWLPLLNAITSLFAIYFGVTALVNIKKNPAVYSGKNLAIIGIILGALPLLFYLLGFVDVYIVKAYNLTGN